MSAILVIEDDPSLTFVLKDSLEFEGHTAVTVSIGALGLQKILELRPDSTDAKEARELVQALKCK